MRLVPRPTLTSSTLKDYLATGKTKSRLLGPLDRHLMGRQDVSDRRTDVLHPSEIIKADWCHRASYHLLNGAPKPPQVKRLRSESIFETGHESHRKYQRWLQEMGNLKGDFRCGQCGVVDWDVSPTCCPACGANAFVYAEVPAVSVEHRIQGKADGWVTGLGEDFLLEIKTIGPGTIRFEQPSLLADRDGDILKAWADIKRPFLNHRRQAGLYVELLHHMRPGAPEEIVFLYEFKATQECKEFVVRRRPELVADVFDAALDVVSAVEHQRIPECNIKGPGFCAKCKPFEALAYVPGTGAA